MARTKIVRDEQVILLFAALAALLLVAIFWHSGLIG
jgi:hypothetical protein